MRHYMSDRVNNYIAIHEDVTCNVSLYTHDILLITICSTNIICSTTIDYEFTVIDGIII